MGEAWPQPGKSTCFVASFAKLSVFPMQSLTTALGIACYATAKATSRNMSCFWFCAPRPFLSKNKVVVGLCGVL